MSVISSVDPIAAPLGPQAREQREQPNRPPVNFGGAVTHRELVQAKVRVEPAALAEKKRAAAPTRQQVEDAPRDEPGQHVDIEV